MDLLATRNNKHCSKCGSTKQSGKQSCCARGGAWFENCGDVGDTQFDHTWAEGIKVCEGELLTGSLMLWIAVRILLVKVIAFLTIAHEILAIYARQLLDRALGLLYFHVP